MSSEEEKPKLQLCPITIIVRPTKEGLKEYESKLVQILPLDDFVFRCMLIMYGVFTEDELTAIQSQVASSDSVTESRYCLDHIISNEESFERRTDNLLSAMEDFEMSDDVMKNLAKDIRMNMNLCELLCMFNKS